MPKHQACMVISGIALCLALETYAQVPASGPLRILPEAVVPQVQRLAQLLQQNVAHGKLTDAQIQTELQQGNLAAMIQGLSSEAANLLDQIKTVLRSHYTEVELNAMLQGLLNTASPSIVPSTQ